MSLYYSLLHISWSEFVLDLIFIFTLLFVLWYLLKIQPAKSRSTLQCWNNHYKRLLAVCSWQNSAFLISLMLSAWIHHLFWASNAQTLLRIRSDRFSDVFKSIFVALFLFTQQPTSLCKWNVPSLGLAYPWVVLRLNIFPDC